MQGRKSRFRGADDIERIVRQNAAQNISRFFITDDYFARNKNWEPIFDRLIELREQGFKISFLIQVDTLAHKIPRFIEKAARAGCRYAFIGLESINPDNLVQMKKNQNRTTEYRTMFQAWKNAGMVTYAGFIIGLPGDTPASVRRDLNKYDLETATVEHPRMSREERQRTYWDAWNWYHSDEHVERMMRRRGVRARYRIQADPQAITYSDLAITPVTDAEDEALEMFTFNNSARSAVEKARAQAQRRRQGVKSALSV